MEGLGRDGKTGRKNEQPNGRVGMDGVGVGWTGPEGYEEGWRGQLSSRQRLEQQAEEKQLLGRRKTFPNKDGLGCLGKCE